MNQPITMPLWLLALTYIALGAIARSLWSLHKDHWDLAQKYAHFSHLIAEWVKVSSGLAEDIDKRNKINFEIQDLERERLREEINRRSLRLVPKPERH